ncbi:ATP-binding protein [soil metagenome]
MTDPQTEIPTIDSDNDSLEALNSDESTVSSLSGFRLHRLEIYNWGTFNGQVRTLNLDGNNCLMTGDIGSGKSTVVDAITTLLMPHTKIAYNKVAGADSKERSLLSYVLGYYKSEQSESTGAAKPIQLRDQNSYAVILGEFHNEGFNKTITLAQVFWLKDLQTLARLYVAAERSLTITKDFSNFGTDMLNLKKRLNAAEIELFDHFPKYGAWFRRRFGINSEQAMDLFHQTVSMKSVGSVTDFVRTHMLEPFDVDTRIKGLLAHFDDLNRAHEAVLKAANQVKLLTPLIADCSDHAVISSDREQLRSCREHLKVYFAKVKEGLLEKRIEKLNFDLNKQLSTVEKWQAKLETFRLREAELQQSIRENGGNRIDQINSEIERVRTQYVWRKDQFETYEKNARRIGLIPPTDIKIFEKNREQFADKSVLAKNLQSDLQNSQMDVNGSLLQEQKEHQEIDSEIESLRKRKSNIPRKQIELRLALCSALNLSIDEIPFAGELLQLRENETDWEGAVERLLHSFGLSLLVPDKHYIKVCDYVDQTHLKGKIVYYRNKESVTHDYPQLHRDSLVNKLSIKPNSPFYDWLEREVSHRFDYACCRTQEQFRKESKAIMQSGQIKNPGNRHEKDDTHRIDDRSRYILGWSNEAKLAILVGKEKQLLGHIASLKKEIAEITVKIATVQEEISSLSRLSEYTKFDELDWQPLVLEISKLEDERKLLETTSDILKKLTTDLNQVQQELKEIEKKYLEERDEKTKFADRLATAETNLIELRSLLRDDEEPSQKSYFEKLDLLRTEILGETTITVENCQNRETDFRHELQKRLDAIEKRLDRLAEKITSAMSDYRHAYPQDTLEVDVSVDSANDYTKMLKQLEENDLPRFQSRFKEMLNENTIREVAQFQSQLAKERETIKDRIDKINESLTNIDYNDGRYIILITQPTMDAEIRDFQSELRNCTEGSFTGSEDEQYSEAKFNQVKLILERFRGREGQTDLDERWTKKVTDVRNWFFFGASERYRSDDSVFDHYSDSDGKSGGQKEKLAYTILAASLAYQFGLQWGDGPSRSFRFVVIDEAFGRGSNESAKFGLTLFKQLQLQLLVVTPLQKVKVIEPFVSNVGFVHNVEGCDSRIRNMTIEEYHREKASFLKDVD